MTYWRSVSQFEVNLLIGTKAAIEIKGTQFVQDKNLKGLRALKEEGLVEKYIIVSCDAEPRETGDGIQILPWADFLHKLWAHQIC